MRKLTLGCLVVGLFLFVPALASAQSIGGSVSDSTGGVLPGVTVEVRSPALIEQVRTAITDGSGQYLVVALESGDYSVTFSLPGFGTVVREGITLAGTQIANVDAELSVGAVEETITVSGQSPIVDVQTVTQQQVATREVMDSVPVAKSFQSLGVLIPGITTSGTTSGDIQDVGGASGNNHMTMAIHGGRTGDQHMQVDGMSVEAFTREDSSNLWMPNANFQEYAYDYAANTAETETGGVRVNMIPREGSNQFSIGSVFQFSHADLQSENIDQSLIDRGIGEPNRLKELWDLNITGGGPLIDDRLWFFATHTRFETDNYRAGTFFNEDVRSFAPQFGDEQAYAEQEGFQTSIRLTAQITPRNKIGAYAVNGEQCHCFWLIGRNFGLTIAPEASIWSNFGDQMYQLSWTSPVTSRLLFEVGASSAPQVMDWPTQPFSAVDIPGILEVIGLVGYRNSGAWWSATDRHYSQSLWAYKGAMSYVTGSHALKVGTTITHGTQWLNRTFEGGPDMRYLTLFGGPLQATFYGEPDIGERLNPNLGLYAQDQWTLDRLTLNAGVRFDYFKNTVPESFTNASEFIPVDRLFPEQVVTGFKDLSPRIAVSYDIFGDGRTAIKGSANRYVLREGVGYARDINPIGQTASVSRSWSDTNGNEEVDADFFNNDANGELGASTNLNFGATEQTIFYDQDWAFGWRQRPANWEFSGSVQHELLNGVGLDIGYFRRTYTNFQVVDNRALGEGDISLFDVTAPVSEYLPGGGGYQVTGVGNINPDKVGQIDNITTSANSFGGRQQHWNGLDVNADIRREGMLFQGGFSFGRTTENQCDTWTGLPELQLVGGNGNTVGARMYCQEQTAWLTNIKALGSYNLPYDFQLSATYQSIPGPERLANVVYTSAEVEGSLGRPLAGLSSVTVNVLEPGTTYGERLHQLDFRVTRNFNLGGQRLRVMFDLYNIFNNNVVLTEEYALLGNYLQPNAILSPRLMKFGFQYDW